MVIFDKFLGEFDEEKEDIRLDCKSLFSIREGKGKERI